MNLTRIVAKFYSGGLHEIVFEKIVFLTFAPFPGMYFFDEDKKSGTEITLELIQTGTQSFNIGYDLNSKEFAIAVNQHWPYQETSVEEVRATVAAFENCGWNRISTETIESFIAVVCKYDLLKNGER